MQQTFVPVYKQPALLFLAILLLPVARNVQLIGSTGTATRVGNIRGLPDSPIQGVSFRDCHIVAEKVHLAEPITNLGTTGLKLEVKNGPASMQASTTNDQKKINLYTT